MAAVAVLASQLAMAAARVDLRDDYDWLVNQTEALLLGCQLRSATGTTLFTPDATHGYGAQWTRDFVRCFRCVPTR
jgi:hypothetical protein